MKFVIAALAIATVSAKCENLKATVYKDEKCEKEDTDLTEEMEKNYDEKVLKKATKCVKLGEKESSAVVCDTKSMRSETYKTDDCSGDGKAVMTIKWGECEKVGGKYLKLKGSAALSAGAAAIFALAASQF